MGTYPVRLGAVAGWIGFVGVVALFIVIPMILAGQPPTGRTEASAVIAYFRHPEFALMNGVLGTFFGVVAVIPFGVGLRAALSAGAGERTRTFADLGLVLLVVAAPVYLVSGALGAMLVDAANRDAATFATLFRFYELLYHGGADILEGAWMGAFSIAMLSSGVPRWLGWLGIVAGLSRWVKAFGTVAPVPDVIDPISGVLFVVWFLGTVVALTRLARRPAAVLSETPPLA